MPKRKHAGGSSKSTKRARSRKVYKAKRRSKTTTVVRGRGPVAPRTIVKLKYCDYFYTNGTTLDHVFNLNSIYDPNHTGTGHQPLGHDTYQVLYGRYRVFGCKVIVQANTGSGLYKITYRGANTLTADTVAEAACEAPGAFTKTLMAGVPHTFQRYFSCRNIVGVTKAAYMAGDNYQAAFGASPSETIGLHVVASALDGSAAGATSVAFNITLVYHVEMFDPKDLAQS